MKKINPVILSGGSGTRLWPLSRKSTPKQFLQLFTKNSLFQETISRSQNPSLFEKPLIICNNEHRFLAAEELRKIGLTEYSIILEPIGRNTAPAITLAALEIARQNPDNDLLLVMPSDHLISDQENFLASVKHAIELAEAGYLITFGVLPDRPDTNYGYIEKGQYIKGDITCAQNFIEKPEISKATELYHSGNYLWNSGIFMFRAKDYLEQLKNLSPAILENCLAAHSSSKRDLDFLRIDQQHFENCPNISIDYAVMEKCSKIALVPLKTGWNDVGGWRAIADLSEKDSLGNSVKGDAYLHNTSNCYIDSDHGLLTTVGVKDLIIINLKDVVLVASKSEAQNIKKIYEILQAEKREEIIYHPQVFRPWGSFEVLEKNQRFKIKKITVKPGASLSLQLHKYRAEHWIIIKGEALVTCGDKQFNLNEDQSTYIPIGEKHRIENKAQTTLELIEVQTGSYLAEDDIIRFNDIYGR